MTVAGVYHSFLTIVRAPFLLAIRVYQKTISPDHGFPSKVLPFGVCRFEPTCSEYGYQAIQHHGIFKGGMLTAWRVLRCNPWTKGGIDEVPK